MRRYILRRLLLMPVLLFGITIFDFAFINAAPGDPVSAMLDPDIMLQLSPEYIEARKRALGLDKPIPVRYVLWLKEVANGNLGYSIIRRRPVAELMFSAWQKTALLVVFSLLFSTVGGSILGVVSALKPYSTTDYLLTIFAFMWVAMPSFFFALILIYVGAVRLDWFPVSGLQSTTPATYPLLDRLHHLLLPMFAVSIGTLGGKLRYIRSSMLEVLSLDYIVVARAKGLRERAVIVRHAFRNAMMPLVTIVGLSIPSLIGGSFIVEVIFNIPGIGSLMVDSTAKRDYPMMMGGLLLSAVMILFANLLTDIAYAVVDPRIRYD